MSNIIDDSRTDQELLELKEKTLSFREKYKNNIVEFTEDMHGIKLYPWQKAFLNTWNNLDRCKEYICNIPFRHGKQMIAKAQLEYMKAMEMDFQVWKSECIEVYEKGMLMRTIRKDNEND